MNYRRLLQVDRRVIFTLMGAAIVLPLLFPFYLPLAEQPPTRELFEAVERIDPARHALMISTDYNPQTEAENQPMTVVLIRHGLARKLRVVVISLYDRSIPLAAQAMNQVMREFNGRAQADSDTVVYGRDIALLGWVPPPLVPILGMGESIKGVYKVDYYGTSTDSLEIMRGLRNYGDFGLVCAVSMSASPEWYLRLAQPRFGFKVGAAVTAVVAPQLYPYRRSGQLSGLLAGMRGAAEYENLVEEKYHLGFRRRALEGMGPQSIGHLLILALVLVGNAGYLLTKKRPT